MVLLGLLGETEQDKNSALPTSTHGTIARQRTSAGTGFEGQSPAVQRLASRRAGIGVTQGAPAKAPEPRKKEHVTSSNQARGPVAHPALLPVRLIETYYGPESRIMR